MLSSLSTHYPDKKSCLLPALWEAQARHDGYLSQEALAEVAESLGRSYAEVEGVATFYSMYNTAHKPAKHKIEICTCLTCAVCGAYPLLDYLKKKLGVDLDQVTDDGLFMLEEVECLNACDRAPLIQIGDEYHGPVDEQTLDQLIEKLQKVEKSTVVRLANEIVKVHLSQQERSS